MATKAQKALTEAKQRASILKRLAAGKMLVMALVATAQTITVFRLCRAVTDIRVAVSTVSGVLAGGGVSVRITGQITTTLTTVAWATVAGMPSSAAPINAVCVPSVASKTKAQSTAADFSIFPL